jgi:excisionase family DNA binding protein
MEQPERPLIDEGTRLLSISQAASYLGVSVASLRKWSNEGLVPAHRTPGGQRRYSQADLDEFVQSLRAAGAADRGQGLAGSESVAG